MNNTYKNFNIGKSKSGAKINWSFGHKDLANNHMLITGTSGYGKTHCLKHLLLEAMNNGISSVVIDYSGVYINPNDLFIEKTGRNIKKFDSYVDGIPIDLFKKHSILHNGSYLIEKSYETAGRISDTLESVFRLGLKQKDALYNACKKMLDEEPTKIKKEINMDILLDILSNENNTCAKDVSAKIRPFVDANIFRAGALKWEDIIYSKGKINIFNLNNLNVTLQKITTEFILWDLWNYTLKEGNTSKPFIVVLDECQNLNYKPTSPVSKILTEGRKFGWSVWLSTQYISKDLLGDSINRIQQPALRIFFKPTNQCLKATAKEIDLEKHKLWIPRLESLNQGDCVVSTHLQNIEGDLYPNTVVTTIPPI